MYNSLSVYPLFDFITHQTDAIFHVLGFRFSHACIFACSNISHAGIFACSNISHPKPSFFHMVLLSTRKTIIFSHALRYSKDLMRVSAAATMMTATASAMMTAAAAAGRLRRISSGLIDILGIDSIKPYCLHGTLHHFRIGNSFQF